MDLPIPPRGLRKCGPMIKRDSEFLRTGKEDAQRLADQCGMGDASVVLDIGCSCGRFPLGIMQAIETVSAYHGIDVERPPIAWCQANLSTMDAAFQFYHLDLHNDRYNPRGKIKMNDNFELPFDEGRFDIVYAYSVFTHLTPHDVLWYLAEINRLLKPEATAYITAFLEEDVPPVTFNPPDYPPGPSGRKSPSPLHRVRYSLDYFDDLLEVCGLVRTKYTHRSEWNSQSAVMLQRTNDE